MHLPCARTVVLDTPVGDLNGVQLLIPPLKMWGGGMGISRSGSCSPFRAARLRPARTATPPTSRRHPAGVVSVGRFLFL